ncbi:hypothetical protein ABGV43_20525 [Paenibacillus amylolyticus]
MKTIIISLSAALFITSFILLLILWGREDPTLTTYTCSKTIYSDRKLNHEKIIKVTSAQSFEEGINVFSPILQLSNTLQITNEANALLSRANLAKADRKTTSLTIPKDTCYVSPNEANNNPSTIDTVTSPKNLAVYNWVKTTWDHYSNKTVSINIVIIINDSAIFIQINASDNIIFGLKSKITTYSLAPQSNLTVHRQP